MGRREGRDPLHRPHAPGGGQQGQRRAQQARRHRQEDGARAHARAAAREGGGGATRQGPGEAAGGNRPPRPRAALVVHERDRDRPRAEPLAPDDRERRAVVEGVQRAARAPQGRHRGQAQDGVRPEADAGGARARARDDQRRAREAGGPARAQTEGSRRGQRQVRRRQEALARAGRGQGRRGGGDSRTSTCCLPRPSLRRPRARPRRNRSPIGSHRRSASIGRPRRRPLVSLAY